MSNFLMSILTEAFIFLAGMINCNQQIDIDTTVQQLNLFISSISFPLQNMFSKSTKNNVYPHKEIKVLSYYGKAVKWGVHAPFFSSFGLCVEFRKTSSYQYRSGKMLHV